MYHAIGFEDEWGYYPLEDYLRDVRLLGELDYWGGNMEFVACYIIERNRFSWHAAPVSASGDTLKYDVIFEDGLDNGVYCQQLTLEIAFPDSVKIGSVLFEWQSSFAAAKAVGGRFRFDCVPDGKTRRLHALRATDTPSAIKAIR